MRRTGLWFVRLTSIALLAIGFWLVSQGKQSYAGVRSAGSPYPLPSRSPSADVQLNVPAATASPAFIATSIPTATNTVQPTPAHTATLTPRPPMPAAPDYLDPHWQSMPIVPQVSPAMKAVYHYGLALGNDPRAFSKVGDCNTETAFFLTPFDNPEKYRLGPYADLQRVIDNFAGSFSRASLAAKSGFGPSAMFAPLWADPSVCLANEGPLACEYRIHRPSLVLIGLGTHYQPLDEFESRLRAVIEFSLDRGVVPILATKVDVEGGDRVNALIVYLAQQYEVPLWNFWRAAQPLYNHGQPDGIHFYWASNYFDSDYALRNGWPVRNLTALQALQAVWQAALAEAPEDDLGGEVK